MCSCGGGKYFWHCRCSNCLFTVTYQQPRSRRQVYSEPSLGYYVDTFGHAYVRVRGRVRIGVVWDFEIPSKLYAARTNRMLQKMFSFI